MGAEELLEALERDSGARLKWLVLRRLGAGPLSPGARLMTKRRALLLACHMLLDGEEKALNGENFQNPGFDPERFEELRRQV